MKRIFCLSVQILKTVLIKKNVYSHSKVADYLDLTTYSK